MQHLPVLTATIICIVTIGYFSRVVYVAADRFFEGAGAGVGLRAEILQNIGFLAALYGLIGNDRLTVVGLLVNALGVLLEPESKAQPPRLAELPLAWLALAAVVGIGACQSL